MALATATGLLGAPGIRVAPPEPVRSITGVRRDIAAFVGVAPRGPARLPPGAPAEDDAVKTWLAATPVDRSIAVPVTSWDEYCYHFGGFEGPGRLPYAVSAFFAQGGERAYVVRVVHDYSNPVVDFGGRARGDLGTLTTTAGDPLRLLARSEGAWGNRLRATLRFAARPIALVAPPTATNELVVERTEWVPIGTLLRVHLTGDVMVLRYVDESTELPDPLGPGTRRHIRLATPSPSVPIAIDVVTATLEVIDLDPRVARREAIGGVGLRADHPRFLARALVAESSLVWPDLAWTGGTVSVTDASLAPVELTDTTGVTKQMSDGADRWADIVPGDYSDPGWTPGDERPGAGVQCLGDHDDIGLLVAPDLYDPQPIAPIDDVTDPLTLCGPDFEVHVDIPPPLPATPAPPGLAGLALDPLLPADLAAIVAAQRDLVSYADARRDLTVLLDVPPGLAHRQIMVWRNSFDSPFAAAYYPWLDVAAPDDLRDSLVRVNPSAFAAGITAARERRLGVQHGPANEPAVGAVRVAAVVPGDRHDELHPAGVNVFVPTRDSIRLTGARTLSRDPLLRQLSVARLMTVVRLSLEREMAWVTFEPNNDRLWAEVRRMVRSFLTRLYEAGAFRGATTKEAFFVHCDRTTMTTNDLDNGRFICLVGVAPAEPIEYLILELSRDRDTSVRVEMATG